MSPLRFELLLFGDRLRDDWKALKALGPWRFIYSTYIYRSHMRWLHKRGKHGRRTRPIDGLRYCDWCGHMEDGCIKAANGEIGKDA